MQRIVVASQNAGKLKEFGLAFAARGIEVVPIRELVSQWEVEETGSTFHENAMLKAAAAMKATGLPALADDSGLSVYYLGGAPGLYSQRYAGCGAGDKENNALLLQNMTHAKGRRQAHFTAVLAVVFPDSSPVSAVGRLYGSITESPRGDCGFGYDPLFEVRGTGLTLAQMTIEDKNRISHRAIALQKIISCLLAAHAG